MVERVMHSDKTKELSEYPVVFSRIPLQVEKLADGIK
jgi:hypothetical protein